MPPLYLFKFLLYAAVAGLCATPFFIYAFKDAQRGALGIFALAVACIASTFAIVALYDQAAALVTYYKTRDTRGRV